jgi:trehalose 6-phosphate synthase/phosphatase
MAVPTEDTLTALTALAADPRNLVYIISGRDGAFLEQHLGHIRGLGMSAEHGGFIRAPGSDQWTNFTESLDMSWMNEVLEVFKYYTERTTGSHIEVKKSSITWHYRSTDPEWGCVRQLYSLSTYADDEPIFRQFQCRQCQDLLENNVAHKRPIEGTVTSLFYYVVPRPAFWLSCSHSTCGQKESRGPPDRNQQRRDCQTYSVPEPGHPICLLRGR